MSSHRQPASPGRSHARRRPDASGSRLRKPGLRSALATARRRVRPVTSVVTPLGASVLAAGISAWLLARWLGWVELLIAATASLLLFALCALFTLGRTRLRVTVELDPARVTVGDPAAGRIEVTNISRRRMLPIALELPVGQSGIRFSLPSLGGDATHEEMLLIPTARRGVIPVGPATTVRGDPLGLLRRAYPWTGTRELFVHPRITPLESLGSGLLKDLEGQTTTDLSMSDLAFQALREYVPGDDRRHIHWRSSAKLGSSVPGGRFLVRQFLDTRRSHVTVVVDGQAGNYADEDTFETAVSCGASVAVRAIRDEIDTTVVIADVAVEQISAQLTLDGFARALYDTGPPLPALAGRAARLAPDTSVALLVSGAASTFDQLRRAAAYFAPEVNTVALRVDPSRPAAVAAAGGLTVLSLPHLGDLAALLRGAAL